MSAAGLRSCCAAMRAPAAPHATTFGQATAHPPDHAGVKHGVLPVGLGVHALHALLEPAPRAVQGRAARQALLARGERDRQANALHVRHRGALRRHVLRAPGARRPGGGGGRVAVWGRWAAPSRPPGNGGARGRGVRVGGDTCTPGPRACSSRCPAHAPSSPRARRGPGRRRTALPGAGGVRERGLGRGEVGGAWHMQTHMADRAQRRVRRRGRHGGQALARQCCLHSGLRRPRSVSSRGSAWNCGASSAAAPDAPHAAASANSAARRTGAQVAIVTRLNARHGPL